MNKVHNILEDLREAALNFDAEIALGTIADIRERLYELDVDLNSGDWEITITAINNYLNSWLRKHARDTIKREHYIRAVDSLQTPSDERSIRNWLADIKEHVLPVMHTIYHTSN